jgi:hypothetical protein
MALLHRSDRKGGARNLSCVAGIPEDTTRIAPRERKLARAVQARRGSRALSSKRVAGRRYPAPSQHMLPLHRPAPPCSPVFKSNPANADSRSR